MERRFSARIASREKKKQKLRASAWSDSAAGRLGFVLELDTGSVWPFLSCEDTSNLMQAFSDILSRDFMEALSLEEINKFAAANKTHVGRQCECDWLRRLDFKCLGNDNCLRTAPFTLNKSLPILKAQGRGLALFSALMLAKRILVPYCVDDRRGNPMFAPVVCLLTGMNDTIYDESAVKKVMNHICKGSGTRFFYNFTGKHGYKITDSIAEHWSSIEGSTCRHCNTLLDRRFDIPRRKKWSYVSIPRIQTNCTTVYRPLKAAMQKELLHVRYIPRPHGANTKYRGLVAGISHEGAFCGLYVANEFWPY